MTAPAAARKRVDPAALALVLVGAALLVWIGRASLFTVDDLLWFVGSPGLDLEGALEPHNGHLIATSRVLYHASFEVFGAEYAPFRIATAVAAALAAYLYFVWVSRRVPRAVALATTALLLLLGTSYVFLIAGDGLMVQLAIAAGIGALLGLERGDRLGDVLACALLTLGVVTYSVALGFVVAAAAMILLDRRETARRIWVPLVPALVYGIWWIWSQGRPAATSEEIDLLNLLVAIPFALDSLASTLGALTGLDYDFGETAVRPEFDTTTPLTGPILAAGAIAAFAWRVRRGAVPVAAWAALAFLTALWVLGALTSDAASPPDATRFVLFISVGVLMLFAASAAGMAWTRNRLIAFFVVAAFGIAMNFSLLVDGGQWRRDVDAPALRAELTGVEMAGTSALDRPDLSRVAGGGAIVAFPFAVAGADDYLGAVDRYGSFGFTAEELRAQDESVRARADAMLISARGTELEPATAPPTGCERVKGDPDFGTPVDLPPGGAILEAQTEAPVTARRFADDETVPVGTLEPGEPAALRLPPDAAPDPWRGHVGAASAVVCPL